MPASNAIPFRNRILRYEPAFRAGDLLPNPRNWRRHPPSQQSAMRGVLQEIGFADAVLAYETPDGLMLVDGHLRASLDADSMIPVLVTDLDESEADKVMVTLDPLAAMAQTDQESLASLLDSTTFDDNGISLILESLLNGGELLPPGRAHGMPDIDVEINHAVDTLGYGGGSVWPPSGEAETRAWHYLLPLPPKPDADHQSLLPNYSRSAPQELEWIVRTYMRPGDHFLEACAGWWTFSTTAALWGYSGAGLDIWDTSIEFGYKQLGVLPQGAGRVRVVEGDAAAMPFEDGTFDFVYCNPPFFQLEQYSDDERDLASHSTLEEWLASCEEMMREMARVAKPGALIVTVMADYRTNGVLIPLHSHWMDAAARAGLILHDMVIQHLRSQSLRLWTHSYRARRTGKAHEYVITFRTEGGDPFGSPPSGDGEYLEESDWVPKNEPDQE